MENNDRQQPMKPMCHVCDARVRGGLPPLRECERCGGDGTATKLDMSPGRTNIFTTTVAAEALRTINGYLGIKAESPPEVTVQTLRELIDKADDISRELGELQRKRPMTEEEEKLVVAALMLTITIDDVNHSVRPELADLLTQVSRVVAERKPPEPRPITPEELAVVEAAEEWWRFTGNHLEELPSRDQTARGDLQRAVRELCISRNRQGP